MTSAYDIAPHAVTGVLQRQRLQAASRGFTTRRVELDRARLLLGGAIQPAPGDLVLARVDELRHHTKLQRPDGRRRVLFQGDEIIVCYGDRYAPNQFEAVVPDDLGPCHLVAAGGVAAKAVSWHRRIGRGPTRITPLGLLGDASGQVMNLAQFALPRRPRPAGGLPPVIASVGTAMDSGKTTTAAYLVRGLSRAGLQVAFAKVTGTGACGDIYLLEDAGAHAVVDFCDAGYVSTYRLSDSRVQQITQTLVHELAADGPDAIVVEVADGLLQQETAALVRSPTFRQLTDAVVFCAGDALGAAAGVERLRVDGHHVLAVSGKLTAAPLAVAEAQQATGLPVCSLAELADPVYACSLIDGCARPRRIAASATACA